MNKLKELLLSRKVWLTVAAIVGAIAAAHAGTLPADEAMRLVMQNIGALVVALGLVDAGNAAAGKAASKP